MIKRSLFFYMAIIFVAASVVHGSQEDVKAKRNIKVLVLIIASDEEDFYVKLQKMWRSYMHYNPNQIETYFIKGDPNLPTLYKIDQDVIWSRTHECFRPGIINKTLISLEAFLPRMANEFDYVLRTNLSSFYVFPKLLHFLQSCPTSNFYCGVRGEGFASGSGFIMSPDVVQLLMKNDNLFNNIKANDDVLIGQSLLSKGIKIFPQNRIDIFDIKTWYDYQSVFPKDVFQFRIKNHNKNLRLVDDLYIYSQLLNTFYHH